MIEDEMPMGGGAPATSAPMEGGGETMSAELTDATPEEQELYERFVGRAYQMVYSEKMRGQIKQMLAGGGDPVEGLARTTALVVGRVALAAEKGGAKLKGDVVFAAGKEIFEDLAEFSKVAGIKDYSKDPKALEGAFFRALDHFRLMMTQAGRANPETFKPDMDKLTKMNETGELDTYLRRLAEIESERRASGEEEQPDGEAPERGGGMGAALEAV